MPGRVAAALAKWVRPRRVAHATHATAQVRQKAYRFRNDDGGETNATWKAAKDTNVTLVATAEFRLRFVLEEYGGAEASADNRQVWFSYNSGAWTRATGTSSYLRLGSSDNFTDATATTQQVGSGTFSSNGRMNETGSTEATAIPANNEIEDEHMLKLQSADLSTNDTLEIRSTWSGGTAFDDYPSPPNYPTVTIGTAAADSRRIPIRQIQDRTRMRQLVESGQLH